MNKDWKMTYCAKLNLQEYSDPIRVELESIKCKVCRSPIFSLDCPHVGDEYMEEVKKVEG